MKYILLLFLSVTLVMESLAQENKNFENAVRQSIQHHMKEYPQSTLKDLYKNFFQDVYGPGHMINDTIAAKNYLLKELNSYDEVTGAIAEPTGWQQNFYRVNLSVIKNNIIPLDVFFNAFLQSATYIKPVNPEDWKKEWHRIEEVIRSMELSLPDYEKDSQEIKERLSEGKYVGHHSQLFNTTYKPHYRIINTKIYKEKLFPLINGNTDN